MRHDETQEITEQLVEKLRQEVDLLRGIVQNQCERQRRDLERSEKVAQAAFACIDRLFTAHWRMEPEHMDELMAFCRDRGKLRELLEFQGFCFECRTHFCRCGGDDD